MHSGSACLSEPVIEAVHFRKSYQRYSIKKLFKSHRKILHNGTQVRKQVSSCILKKKILKEREKRTEKATVLAIGPGLVFAAFTKKHEKKASFVLRLKKERELPPQSPVQSVLKRMLKVSIAHGMDPVQRAGQTKASNEREASKYGRRTRKKKSIAMSFCKMLIKLLLMLICPMILCKNFIVKGVLKSLEQRFKPKKKKTAKSYVKTLLQAHSARFAR